MSRSSWNEIVRRDDERIPGLPEIANSNGKNSHPLLIATATSRDKAHASPSVIKGYWESGESAALVGVLAPGAKPGVSRPCPLPRHTDRGRFYEEAGCWHKGSTAEVALLRYVCEGADGQVVTHHGSAEVFAAQAYGRVLPLRPLELARWRERLRFEAGLITPRPVALELPDGCSAGTLKVSGAICLFLGLRNRSAKWAGEPFTWDRRFSMAYVGADEWMARRAVEQLEELGCVHRVGMAGKAVKWQLGPKNGGAA